MNYAMTLDYQSCINCKACEVACKEENGVQLGADKQRIWVGETEKSIFGNPFVNYYPSQCNHCQDAPCVDVCPTGANGTNLSNNSP
jgi:Fe-S-cluster-containing dehydrogenase component